MSEKALQMIQRTSSTDIVDDFMRELDYVDLKFLREKINIAISTFDVLCNKKGNAIFETRDMIGDVEIIVEMSNCSDIHSCSIFEPEITIHLYNEKTGSNLATKGSAVHTGCTFEEIQEFKNIFDKYYSKIKKERNLFYKLFFSEK